jgi:hypothetical protein
MIQERVDFNMHRYVAESDERLFLAGGALWHNFGNGN